MHVTWTTVFLFNTSLTQKCLDEMTQISFNLTKVMGMNTILGMHASTLILLERICRSL
jgi:hypothetical protein